MNVLRRPRDHIAEARELAQRGRSSAMRGNSAEALGWYERALALMHGERPTETLADVLRWKATAHRECGDTKVADRLYEESRAAAAASGYLAGSAHVANCQGIVAHRRGDLEVASRLYAESATLAERAGEIQLGIMVLRNRGVLGSMRGDWSEALECFQSSLLKAEQLGDVDGTMRALNNIALVHCRQRRFAEAEALYQRVFELAGASEDVLAESMCHLNRAAMLLAADRLDEAEVACTAGLGIAERRGDSLRRAHGLMLLARLGRRRGSLEDGEALLHEAHRLVEEGDDALLHGEILREEAAFHAARGDRVGAARMLHRALEVFGAVDARPDVAEVRGELAALNVA